MKYATAIISAIFIFVMVFILMGIVFAWVFPKDWWQITINLGLLSANLPSMIAIILGGLAATATFRASLNAKTGKLYRKPKLPDN